MKIYQDWNSFFQSFPIENKGEIQFRLNAFVKTDFLSRTGSIGIWAKVENKDGSLGFFDNMQNRSIQSEKWTKITLEGALTDESKMFFFGGICYNYGNFYFTKFNLEFQSKDDVFEAIDINNPNFDEENIDDILGWKLGTGKSHFKEVEGYEVSVISDKDITETGKYLKITGKDPLNIIGYTTQIKQLIISLETVSKRMLESVQYLSIEELDFLPNKNVNSIGISLIHIAAIEKYYQILTMRNRVFDEEEKKMWDAPITLREKAISKYKNKSVESYLSIYKYVRNETLELFKEKKDIWLEKENVLLKQSNYLSWYHVLEHQSYHLGQIVMIKKLMQ